MQDGLSEFLRHVGSLTRFERLYTLQNYSHSFSMVEN